MDTRNVATLPWHSAVWKEDRSNPVSLRAQAYSVSYRLERSEVNFGAQELFVSASKHVSLQFRQSRFRIPCDTRCGSCCAPYRRSLSPTSGRLKAGERVRFHVVFLSAIPYSIEKILQLIVAHFEPVPIRVAA